MRRGRLLEAAGRADEALTTYHQALAELDQLSTHRRHTKAIHRIETDLQTAIQRLRASLSSS